MLLTLLFVEKTGSLAFPGERGRFYFRAAKCSQNPA
jgi:hypothetical protein